MHFRDLVGKSLIDDSDGISIGGKGPTAQLAFLSTLGEAAERLLAVFHSGTLADQVEYATYTELQRAGRLALGPADIFLFAKEQYADGNFPFEPFLPTTRLGWVEGTLLRTSEPILVPAQLVLFYWMRHKNEARIGYATSGGLAFHTSRQRAILHGLYENMERDAVNLAWYCRLAPARVNLNVETRLCELGFGKMRMSTPSIPPVKLLLNSLDVPIPVFTAVTIDNAKDELSLLAGGGTWSNRDRALIQSVFEIGQMRTGFNISRGDWSDVSSDAKLSDLTDFFFSSVYYGYRRNRTRLDWYVNNGEEISWEDVPTQSFEDDDEEYAWITNWMKGAGFDPILFDFDSACWPGVYVTKVFVPGLVQAFVPSWPYFGHPRFYEVPRAIGRSNRRLTFVDLNADPLPFP